MKVCSIHLLRYAANSPEVTFKLCFLFSSYLSDLSEVVVDSNESSVWWQKVRNMCGQSDNVRAAYLAVVTCRAVAMNALGLNGPFKVRWEDFE